MKTTYVHTSFTVELILELHNTQALASRIFRYNTDWQSPKVNPIWSQSGEIADWQNLMNVHAETTYQIDTSMVKDLDHEDVWRFETRCFHVMPLAEGGGAKQAIASLNGLLCAPGYVPGTQGYDDTFDVFDSRSGHACAAFEIISDNQDCIDQTLGGMGQLLLGSGLILLERGFVEKKHRGNKIMLSMMRDARKATSGLGRVAMLQAYPDGNEISDQDCRQLAQYYASDTALSFIEISPSTLAGWMVANWSTWNP